MIMYRLSPHNQGGCQFCDKGTLAPSGTALIYPYESITYIETDNRFIVRICDDCLMEITNRAENLKVVETAGSIIDQIEKAEREEEEGKDMIVTSDWVNYMGGGNKNTWVRTIAGCEDELLHDTTKWMAFIDADGISNVRVKGYDPQRDSEDEENWTQSINEVIDPLGWCDEMLEALGHSVQTRKLEPCPLCGADAETYVSPSYQKKSGGASYNAVGVRCTECNVHIHEENCHSYDKKARQTRMITAWNKRTNNG